MKKAVFCVAKNRSHAYLIMKDLIKTGFHKSEISVLISDVSETDHPMGHEKHTKALAAAATGAVVGGLIGGASGLLSGLGIIDVHPMSAMIDIGPIYAALSCSTICGSLGFFLGTLIGLHQPEYVVCCYESDFKENKPLFSVHVENCEEEKKAIQVFEMTGAEDISTALEEVFVEK